jgi:hypothetical protein
MEPSLLYDPIYIITLWGIFYKYIISECALSVRSIIGGISARSVPFKKHSHFTPLFLFLSKHVGTNKCVRRDVCQKISVAIT